MDINQIKLINGKFRQGGYMKEKVLNILQKYYGYKSFRKGQENIITSILQGEDVLAIMPTGGGNHYVIKYQHFVWTELQ